MVRIAMMCALLGNAVVVQAQGGVPVRQVALAGYTLSGTIADPDGNPVSDAQIEVVDDHVPARTTRSDANGRFRLDALPHASVAIRIRRFGYEPRTMAVKITSPDHLGSVFVKLDPHATVLNGVRVQDDEDSTADGYNVRLMGFYERERTNNFGHYIDPEDIARMHPQYPSQVLRDVPGVLIKPTGRIGNIVRLRECGVPGESPEKTGPLIWIDGVRMPGAELDEAILGSDIAAIEVYNSFAGIPAQYFDRSAVCGTILVWTKSR
ncbi:MAG TPA: carboxypeptidase regulatory-like domain-containing protein [Gemmatimonadaceae bacterium]|nr:carboxypeptidase regulatory-like domain-containing protein [Gemmatimonadaceae bacterium]